MLRKADTCGQWFIYYMLYFGRDGREEAESLLERNSGDQDNPRILGTFNDFLFQTVASFFMFTYFTDRDGKVSIKVIG